MLYFCHLCLLCSTLRTGMPLKLPFVETSSNSTSNPSEKDVTNFYLVKPQVFASSIHPKNFFLAMDYRKVNLASTAKPSYKTLDFRLKTFEQFKNISNLAKVTPPVLSRKKKCSRRHGKAISISHSEKGEGGIEDKNKSCSDIPPRISLAHKNKVSVSAVSTAAKTVKKMNREKVDGLNACRQNAKNHERRKQDSLQIENESPSLFQHSGERKIMYLLPFKDAKELKNELVLKRGLRDQHFELGGKIFPAFKEENMEDSSEETRKENITYVTFKPKYLLSSYVFRNKSNYIFNDIRHKRSISVNKSINSKYVQMDETKPYKNSSNDSKIQLVFPIMANRKSNIKPIKPMDLNALNISVNSNENQINYTINTEDNPSSILSVNSTRVSPVTTHSFFDDIVLLHPTAPPETEYTVKVLKTVTQQPENIPEGVTIGRNRTRSSQRKISSDSMRIGFEMDKVVLLTTVVPLLESRRRCPKCPYFLKTKNTIQAAVGMTVKLSCGVRNLNGRQVSWIRRKDLHVLSTGTFTYTNDNRFYVTHVPTSPYWHLAIEGTRTSDSGIYECQVPAQPKIFKRFHLNVIVPRATIEGSREVFMQSGGDIKMICIVQGASPPTHIEWYHRTPNDHTLAQKVNPSVRGGMLLISDNRQAVSWIVMTKVSWRDAGIYSCQSKGVLSAFVTVHVLQEEHPAAMQEVNNNVEAVNGSAALRPGLGVTAWSRSSHLGLSNFMGGISISLILVWHITEVR